MANEPSNEKLEKRARNVLLFQLSRSMKTKKQLAIILEKREIPAEIALPLLDRFEEVSLIDDQAFAYSYVRSRVERGKSARIIGRELSQKGVPKAMIEVALAEIDPEDEAEMALQLARSRWERLGALEKDAKYRRVSGFLMRRGFSSGLVSSVLRDVSSRG
ncbi:MAG: regulatory protein RecX [Aquiluna sp.]|nr:regulatory protein RecX [Aquiluna sp.]